MKGFWGKDVLVAEDTYYPPVQALVRAMCKKKVDTHYRYILAFSAVSRSS